MLTKVILLAVIMNVVQPGDETTKRMLVAGTISAEFDNDVACKYAEQKLALMGAAAGSLIIATCTPKGIAKLEVVPPKKEKPSKPEIPPAQRAS